MQITNQLILPLAAQTQTPLYPPEYGNQSPTSPSDDKSCLWAMESGPQLLTDDDAFWRDVSTFICSGQQKPFEYRSDDLVYTNPKNPNEGPLQTMESTAEPSQPRARGQTLELLLKRRAQNRASQRAYRDRRDQHIRGLEAQYEEMARRNEELTREHEALRCEHEKLKAEQERWKEAQSRAEEATLERDVAEWAETHLSKALGGGDSGAREGANGDGLVIKVVVCKRCFGEGSDAAVKAKCEE